jgi:HEAT repeat protein
MDRGVALLLALCLQDPLEKSLERWRSDDPSVRSRATEEILSRWKEWRDPDLARLDRAAAGADAEVAAHAREAAARVRLRRRLGETLLSGVAGIDAALYQGSDDECLRVLAAAAALWREKKVSGAEAAAAMEAGAARPWESRAKEALFFAQDEEAPSAELILVVLLRSRDPDVRGRAAVGLGEGRHRQHARAVAALLRDPESLVVGFAGMALARMEAREVAGEVAAFLADERPAVRQAALGCLAKIGGPAEVPKILPFLEDEDSSLRATALEALGGIRSAEHSARVAAHLADRHPDCRRAAALALAMMGARDRSGMLAARLKVEQNHIVRWDVVRALGKLKAGEYAQDLVPLLKDGGGRFPASEALGEMGLKKFAPDVVPLLEDVEPGVRWRAVVALRKMGAWEQGGAIAGALRDTDPLVRRSAMEALSALGAVDQAEKTLDLLADPDVILRGMIRSALGGFVPSRALERAAERFLSDPDRDVVASFVHLAGASGSRACAPRLIPLLRDPDREVRYEAAWALGEVGSPDQVAPLLPLLGDPEEHVRFLAASAVGRLAASGKPEEAWVKALERLEKDPEERPRFAAGCALARLGRKDRAAQRELLRTAEALDRQWAGPLGQMFETLAWLHEPDAYARLDREVELPTRATTVREIEEAFRGAGVGLRVEGEPILARFGPPGWRTSARRALPVLAGGFVIPGDPLRAADAKSAVEYWRKRLDGN